MLSLVHQAPAAHAAPTEADLLAGAMAVSGTTVTGASFVAHPDFASTAVGTTPLAGFPKNGGSFAILSSGNADAAYRQAEDEGTDEEFDEEFDEEETEEDWPGTPVEGPDRGETAEDVTTLKVDISVPAGANCLTGVDFRFLSDEYPDFVGTEYNDAFIMEIDSSTWTTDETDIVAPDNRAFDELGNLITINSAGATTMNADLATGTGLGGSTRSLTAQAPISPGPHSLYFSILDQSDQVLDSAVLLDKLQVGSVSDVSEQCQPGVTPAPSQQVTADAPTFDDTNGTVTIPAHGSTVTYFIDDVIAEAGTQPAAGTISVRAAAGGDTYVNGPSEWSHTYPASPTTAVVPEAPVFTDTTPGEGTVTIPAKTGVEYALNGDIVEPGTYDSADQVDVTAVATTGYHLFGPSTWLHDFNVESGNRVTAAAPTANQAAHTVTIPSSTEFLYSINAEDVEPGSHDVLGEVIVETSYIGNDETAQQDGATSWTFEFPDAPADPVSPTAPTFTDSANGGSFVLPQTSGWTWEVNGKDLAPGTHPGAGPVKVVARAADGKVISGVAAWSHTFLTSATTTITPTAPTFTDPQGRASDTYTIPSQTGVAYLVAGEVVSAGTHPADELGTLKIDAVANVGYQLAGTTTWSHTFTAQTITNTTPPKISGTPRMGSTLTGGTGSWTPGSWSYARKWLRDGVAIPGATAASYALTAADVGKNLTFAVTASGTGVTGSTATSSPVTILEGTAPTVTKKPVITGTPKYNNTLTASSGTWTGGTWTYSYQWLRKGVVIPGATAKTYKVQVADAPGAVSVRVAANRAGYAQGTSTSAGVTVPKLTSTASAALAASSIKKTANGKVTVTVTVPGVAAPAGTVRVRRVKGNTTATQTATLTAEGQRKVTVTLPKLSVGTWKISAQFLGNAQTSASPYGTARTLTVK